MSFEESLKEYEEIGIESPFDQCEDTEEIAYKMNEIVEDELLADEEFQKKSWSELGDNEAGLSVTGTNGRELDETSRTILGQDLDRPLERDASESRELHQDGKAENDESVEDRERGQSSISSDDVSTERDANKGNNRRIDLEKEAKRLLGVKTNPGNFSWVCLFLLNLVKNQIFYVFLQINE